MRLIQSKIPQYHPLDGLSTATIRDFKGVNTYDALAIPDNYFTDVSNVTNDDYPTISTRPGYTVVATPVGTRCTGIGVWRGNRIVAAFNDGSWRVLTLSNTWSSPVVSFSPTDAPWTFANFMGNWDEVNLVGTNGQSGMWRFNGITGIAVSGAPIGANFVTTYSNRLWCAVGQELHACALDRGDDWESFPGTAEDSFGKTIESTRGENINMLSGSLSKLTIGFPNSLVELYGNLPSDFNDRLVTDDTGVASNRTVVTQDGVMMLLHKSGIYQYTGGTIPDRDFSEIIANYPITVDANSVVGADADKIYFKVGTSILVYDTRAEVRSWTVWNGINATCFVFMLGDLYIGDTSGRVLKLGGTTDNGTAISAYTVSKAFSSASIAQRQRWLKLFLTYEAAVGATINVYLSQTLSGDSDWTLVKTIVGDGLPGVQRAMVPVDKIALANYVRIKTEWTGVVKIHEYTRNQRALPLY